MIEKIIGSRNTPAWAGRTTDSILRCEKTRDHPRVGGADSIRQAKEWHVRPLSIISLAQPHDKWERLDFLLIKAYEYLMSAFTCPKCGGWIWDCSSEVDKASGLTHEVKDIICYKTQAIEQHEHDLRPPKDRQGVSSYEKGRWGRYPTLKSYIPKEYADMLEKPTIEDCLESTNQQV